MLAYSVVLNKDPDSYQSYTPQYKIGKSLNKESGSLIKYYKTGLQEDGYKGYSTNYQDLNIDIYKLELWRLVKEILRLLDCDIQKLEYQLFPATTREEDDFILIMQSVLLNTVIASFIWTLIKAGKKEFRFYFAKACIEEIVLKENQKNEIEKTRYLIKALR